MTRKLPAGLARVWPSVVAGVALAVALVAALAVARQYERADDQRQGQLSVLETRADVTRAMVDVVGGAPSRASVDQLDHAAVAAPAELQEDPVVAARMDQARAGIVRLVAEVRGHSGTPAGSGLLADADAVRRSLAAAGERAGAVAERTRREANASAIYTAAGGAFMVAALLWLLMARRRRAAVEAAETRGLRQSELWFRGLVQHSSDAILVARPSGEVRYATPSIERIAGHRQRR